MSYKFTFGHSHTIEGSTNGANIGRDITLFLLSICMHGNKMYNDYNTNDLLTFTCILDN